MKSIRTDDVYELIPGYPKPPLCQIPDPLDLSGLECWNALADRKLLQSILRATMRFSGIHKFIRELPAQLEPALRTHNLRLGDLSTSGLSATTFIADDSNIDCPFRRAASLIISARELRDDITSGKFPADRVGDAVAEMGQYPNLFGTHLVLDEDWARIKKTSNLTQIVVIVSKRFYLLDLGGKIGRADLSAIAGCLQSIANHSKLRPIDGINCSPAIVTSAESFVQLKVFGQLRKDKTNRETLAQIQKSLLTVCLDLESRPNSQSQAAHSTHSSNLENRWFHSGLQIVVFGNSKACTILSFHAYLDGNVMMRGSAELQRRASQLSREELNGESQSTIASSEMQWREMQWNVHEAVIAPIRSAVVNQWDNQEATYDLLGFGTEYFESRQLDPVGTFVVALQMTANRLTKTIPKINQFLSQSAYCCMGLRTVVVSTPEVIQLAQQMENDEVAGSVEKRSLLEQVANSHRSVYRAARPYLRLEEVIQLYVRMSKGLSRIRAVISLVIGIVTLRLFAPSDLRADIVISHPAIFPEVPVVGRPGAKLPYVKYFGLHYQIHPDRTTFTLMPSLNWHVPNQEFATMLKANMIRLTNEVSE